MSKDSEITREFDDNSLMQILVGPQNENIHAIETLTGTVIRIMGNVMTISGAVQDTNLVSEVLDALYVKISKGQYVELADVKAAIRIRDMSEEKVEVKEKKPEKEILGDDVVIKTMKRHIRPRTATQAEYIKTMQNKELVFGLGPAGTGKTYLAVARAVSLMTEGKVDKIILSRPAVEAGEHLGFLPGDMKEKIDPYLRPLYDALYEMMPSEIVNKKIASGEIEIAPLAFMRGRTLSNAAIILDEAQNTTSMQMKMFLTRLGENSRMVINGDMSQTDLPSGMISGLADAIDVVKKIKGVGVVKFNDTDVVRHGLVAEIVKAYDTKNRILRGDSLDGQ